MQLREETSGSRLGAVERPLLSNWAFLKVIVGRLENDLHSDRVSKSLLFARRMTSVRACNDFGLPSRTLGHTVIEERASTLARMRGMLSGTN